MTEHTYRDKTWRAYLMGSEGWAVFAGPRMLASHLPEDQARLIAATPKLLEALKRIAEYENPHLESFTGGDAYDMQAIADVAIRDAEEQGK